MSTYYLKDYTLIDIDCAGVYIITNLVNGKRYVGQSATIRSRLASHVGYYLRKEFKKHPHLYHAFAYYGLESFVFSIVYATKSSQRKLTVEQRATLDTKEQYYIAVLEATDPHRGYNRTYGGFVSIPTVETRKKISESNTGKIVSEKTRQRIGAKSRGRKWPDASKEKQRQRMTGYVPTKDTLDKLKKALKGRSKTDEHRKALSNAKTGIPSPLRVPIICLHTGITYDSATEARKLLGLQKDAESMLHKCCKGACTQYGGKEWCYLHELSDDEVSYYQQYGNLLPLHKNSKSKPVLCIESKTTYESCKQASEATGVGKSNIAQVCRGVAITAGGFHWKFV